MVRAEHKLTHGETLTVKGCVMIVVGDGRAQEAGANTQGGGAARCLKCEDKGEYVGELDKHVYPPKARTHLADDDGERKRRLYATKESGGPPAMRTVETLRCVLCASSF